MRRALRVGVPAELFHLPPHTSVARIWQAALPRLERTLRVRPADPRANRRPRVDVWLTDGHQGPIPVPEPVVAHFHEAAWEEPELARFLDPGFVERYAAPSRAAARAARRLLTVSESSRRQLVSAYGVDPAHVLVAHNGVDLDVHRPGLIGAAELIARAGGDPSRPYVLYVGTLHPRKNLAALRQAMADVAGAGHPHALVLVAGAAPDRADSSDLGAAATLPIAGHRVVNLAPLGDRELAAVVSAASVLCLPSFMEGFGLPVLEAMACATPVVVADRGALPELVGDAGVVVAPTAADVAAGLRRVLEDPHLAASLATRGRQRARAFTWDAMTEVWLQALQAATH